MLFRSNDVDWLMKVKMQGAIQKWVDHSISVTVNLPNDVDEALVNRLYVEAWRSGCKGCTIYRDGSRSGVMISVSKKDKKKEEKKEEQPVVPCKQPEVTEVRPKELACDVVRFQNNKEKWVAFVGLLNGYPYEIFTGLQDDDEGIALPKSVTKGKIIKNVYFASNIELDRIPDADDPHRSAYATAKATTRSEERRVGKECRSRWSPYH